VVEPPCLLLIDDEPLLRQLIESILQGEGFEVRGVGPRLLSFLEGPVPSLVLLDLGLPLPGGLQVLRVMRQQARWKNVPVLVMAGQSAGGELQQALEAGADDFLCKPFLGAELVARVRGLLRLRRFVDDLEQREKNLAVVLELTQALSSGRESHQILRQVVVRAAEAIQVEHAAIVLVDEGLCEGRVVASNGDESGTVLDLASCQELREALLSGERMVQCPLVGQWLCHHDVGLLPGVSSYLLPLLAEQKPLGALVLQVHGASLQGHLLSLARTIASATALALQNARMIEGLRVQRDEVKQAHQEVERRLRSAEPYAHLFESASDGIVVFERGGQLLFANPKALHLCGASGRPVGSLNLNDFLVEDERGLVRSLRRGFRGGVYPHDVDLRLRRLDGQIITVNVGFSTLGKGVILANFRDVTGERVVQSELRKTKAFLESVIEGSADGIITADLRGNVLLFNRAAERCTGYNAGEVVGKIHVEALYPPGLARRIMRLVRDKGGRAEGIRTELISRTGEHIPVLVSVSLLLEEGRAVGSVGVFVDLRERLRIETKLSAIQEELRLREKQSIIAELAGAAAHELNQPLTSVMGYAELLKRKLPVDSPGYGAVDVILGEAIRMAEIIRKIGTITRYETKAYVGQAKILDLERASREGDTAPPPTPSAGPHPSSIPPSSPRNAS
jgi:PAS domain S-box-containing protein